MAEKITLRILRFLQLMSKNTRLLFLLFCVVFGVILGVYTFKLNSQEITAFVSDDFRSFVSLKQTGSFLKIWLSSFLRELPFLSVLFLSGLSLIGALIVPATIFFKGFCVGITLSYIYSAFSLSGVWFSLVIIIPEAVAFCFVIILASRESISFSCMFLKSIMPKTRPVNFYNDMKIYVLRFSFIFFMGIIASFADAIISDLFIKFFNI